MIFRMHQNMERCIAIDNLTSLKLENFTWNLAHWKFQQKRRQMTKHPKSHVCWGPFYPQFNVPWPGVSKHQDLIDRKKQGDPNIANIPMLRICAWAEHQIGRMHCFCQTNDPTSIRRHRQYAHNSFIFIQILFIFLQTLFIFLQYVHNLQIFFIILHQYCSSWHINIFC